MKISILSFIVILAAVVFSLFALDLRQRKKATFLHFLIFIGGAVVLSIFAISQEALNNFGKFFGVTRGADLLVYIGIIVLFYLFFDLINRQTKLSFHLTRLVTRDAIHAARSRFEPQISKFKNSRPEDEFIFFLRAFNESATIGSVIDEIFAAGYRKILVVNDGSRDATGDILEQKIAENPDKILIHVQHSINRGDRGAGAATKTGYAFLSKFWEKLGIQRIVGYDADGQMDIADLPKFRSALQKNPNLDLVLGSRFVPGGEADSMPSARRRILKISRLVTRIFYGIRTSDPHNGYRVISLAALRKFQLTSDGMHYANEINEQIRKHKMAYTEVPVHIRYTDYSLSKGQKNSNSLRIAVEMIYKKFFYK